MSHVSAAVAQRLAYKDMSDIWYYSITLILYVALVGISIALPSNIGPVIDSISAYAVSCMAFFVPGVYYLLALDKFKLKTPDDDSQVRKNIFISKIYVGLGIFNAIVSIGSVVIEITGAD